MRALILLLVFFGLTLAAVIEPFGTELCRLFANNVKLRYPGSCEQWQTCQNGIGIISSCKKGEFYNKENNKCVSKSPDSYCDHGCTNKTKVTWVSDPKSCSGYFKCTDAVGEQGYCQGDLHFSQSKQSCIYKEESTCYGYEYCSVVPNNIPFKNEQDCQKYYVCEKGKLQEKYCDNGYYHTQKGCVPRSEVECDIHPVPIELCGTEKKPIREKFVNDKRSCRGYYYCRDEGDHQPDIQPHWGQCPEDRFFEYDLQACYPAAAVHCQFDRCDGRKRNKVISGDIGCQHYLICDGDLTVGKEKCPNGLYFDDALMECTGTYFPYTACS